MSQGMQGRPCTSGLMSPDQQLSRQNALSYSMFEEFVGPVQVPSGQEITLEGKCESIL